MTLTLPVPIIIVAYGNSTDVVDCLEALTKARSEPGFDVYICENGGLEAFEQLQAALAAEAGPCAPGNSKAPCASEGFSSVASFTLRATGAKVFLGDAGKNLGYGGGVNSWLRPLREAAYWPGALILNPDTAPAPDALSQLMAWASSRKRGMVTGRIVLTDVPDRIHTRGLRWRHWLASTAAVDANAPATLRPEDDAIEQALDAPSGAAVYVTRECLDRIGLMEEKYFLYYEDLDWGLKAKSACGIGYAFDAVIQHKGGTTIGTDTKRLRSEFSTFLEFRNRMLFVASFKPLWLPWSAFISCLRAMELAVVGRTDIMKIAFRGIAHGLRGKHGHPDRAYAKNRRS